VDIRASFSVTRNFVIEWLVAGNHAREDVLSVATGAQNDAQTLVETAKSS